LRFISTAIRSGYYKQLFSSADTISNLVRGVVVPNVGLRGIYIVYPKPNVTHLAQLPDHDMEQFEDDPLEFIRLDLSLPSLGLGGADAATRRQAAADVLQALVSSGYEREATEIVGAWIGTGLQEYMTDPVRNWKAKDSAEYLLTAIATRGSTSQVYKCHGSFDSKLTASSLFDSMGLRQQMLSWMWSNFFRKMFFRIWNLSRVVCTRSYKSMLFGSFTRSETRFAHTIFHPLVRLNHL
jgi:hypothetical protein